MPSHQPPPIVGHGMKILCKAQESVWIKKKLAKVRLDSDNDNGCVYSMIWDVKQVLLKDPSLSEGQYRIFFQQAQICMQSSNDLQSSIWLCEKNWQLVMKQICLGILLNQCGMMHFVQKQIKYKAFNCGEALQLTFLKKRAKLIYYWAKIEEGAAAKTPLIKTVYLRYGEATFALKF